MITAVIYHSKTGFSKKYAEMVGEELNLSVYTIKEAKESLLPKSEVIFVSGLFASKIRALGKANSLFDVKYVLGVGMMNYSTKYENTVFSNNINIPNSFHYLPGGFDYSKLNKFEKFIMNLMKKYYVRLKAEADKEGKTLLPDDQDMYEALQSGFADKVSKEHLRRFLDGFVI